jgi:hypothetical protein
MPVWMVSVWLAMVFPFPESIQYPLACGMMILLQALSWGLVGKGISIALRKIS